MRKHNVRDENLCSDDDNDIYLLDWETCNYSLRTQPSDTFDDSSKGRAMKPKYLIYLQGIVDDLLLKENSSYFQRQEAISRFIAYLNHPNDLAATELAAAVYDSIFKSLYVIENFNKDIRPMFDYINHHKANLFALRGIYGSSFFNTNLTSHYDANLLKYFPGDVLRFLFSLDHKDSIYPGRPSIKKAHYYFYKSSDPARYTGRNWKYSWRTFNKMWTKYKASSHFIYVDMFEHKSMFNIEISDVEFFQKIDRLINNQEEILVYFQRSKFVFEKLKEMLDTRATKALKFPKLPNGLGAIEVKFPELSSGAMHLMSRYTSTHAAS